MSYSKIDGITRGNTRTGVSPFMELPIEKIYPNPDQPRKTFEHGQLEELAASIKANGLLQPVVVVKRGKGHMIISGERRFRAHQLNNDATVRCYIMEADDAAVMELSLVENIQRADLTDFEIAVHIGKLWATGRYALKQELAAAIGKPQSYLSKAFGCLKLDDNIIADLEEARRDVPLSVLEEISRVKDKEVQREVYGKYLDKEVTRDDIKNFRKNKVGTGEEESAGNPEHIKPWIIADSLKDPDGLDYTKIILVSNALGIYTPSRFQDDNAATKHFKITIEEL